MSEVGSTGPVAATCPQSGRHTRQRFRALLGQVCVHLRTVASPVLTALGMLSLSPCCFCPFLVPWGLI